MLGLILWVLFDLMVQVALEAVFGLYRSLDEDEGAWPLAVVFFVAVGCVIGAITACVFPDRVLRPGPFMGVSLLAVPALLGAFMEFWGAFITRRGRNTSHLATWYGGASMGLGLAAGRLALVHFSESTS